MKKGVGIGIGIAIVAIAVISIALAPSEVEETEVTTDLNQTITFEPTPAGKNFSIKLEETVGLEERP